MSLKRGVVFVLLVLLVILSSVAVFALDEDDYRFENLYARGSDNGDGDNDNIDMTFGNHLGSYYGVGCDAGPGWPANIHGKGCYIFGVEQDSCGWRNYDSYGYYVVPHNVITSNERVGIWGWPNIFVLDEDNLNDGKEWKNIVGSNNLRVYPDQGICGYDNHWYKCSEEFVPPEGADGEDQEALFTWASGMLYECVFEDGHPIWELKGEDKDHDNFILQENDCQDDPNEPGLTNPNLCPKKPEDCKSQAENPNHPKCAICIHPEATEVAGDGVDNDCTDGEIGSTNDNMEACTIPENNLFGEAFAWYDNEGGTNNCCGDTPEDDFGLISADGKKICLNIGANNIRPSGDEPLDCAAGWCWLSAQADFQPITIIPEVGTQYDIVSNTDQWLECNQAAIDQQKVTLPLDGISTKANREEANSLYCHKEGSSYAWVQCMNTVGESTAKKRNPGDALFTLPFKGENQMVVRDNYGEAESIDFTGYNTMEAIVRFVDGDGNILTQPRIPFGVTLKIQGIDGELYVEEVLGYAQNRPTYPLADDDQGWIHIQVPIAGLRNVKSVEFAPSEGTENKIQVKTVYLVNDDTLFCSGQWDDVQGSWIDDIDTPGVLIHGRDACNTRYGLGSWIGTDDTGEMGYCCGDDEQEYAPKDGEEYNLAYTQGCWASKPIDQNEPITNVRLDVIRDTKSIDLLYEGAIFEWDISITPDEKTSRSYVVCLNDFEFQRGDSRSCDEENTVTIEESREGDDYVWKFNQPVLINWIGVGYLPQFGGNTPVIRALYENNQVDTVFGSDEMSVMRFEEPTLVDEIKTHILGTPLEDGNIHFIQIRLDDEQSTLIASGEGVVGPEIPVDTIHTLEYPRLKFKYKFSVKNTAQDKVITRFGNGRSEATSAEIGGIRQQVTAEAVDVGLGVQSATKPEFPLSQPCSSEECYFALPGVAPFQIKNPHLGLYDVYHVTKEDGTLKETYITDEFFDSLPAGNIKVVNAKQNVLFVHSEFGENTFEGCVLPEYLQGPAGDNNHCVAYGDNYCDPVTRMWSSEKLTGIGYLEMGSVPANPEEVELEVALLDPEDEVFHAQNRINPASITPGRNILQNTDFTETVDANVLGWELVRGDQTVVRDELSQVEKGVFTIPANQKLRSVEIPVKENQQFRLTVNETNCESDVQFYTAEGMPDEGAERVGDDIHTAGANSKFLEVEFSKADGCTLFQPMLQVLQQPSEPVETYYPGTTKTALACCPQDYCWSGELCVAPGGEAYFVESVDEGRYFRCTGEEGWQERDPLRNWDDTEWGFCNGESQCLVQSTGDPLANLSVFPNTIPTCINEGEWMYDHLCESTGNWTTRTKSIATELLKIAEKKSRNDYSLYCTNYTFALPELLSGEDYFSKPVFGGFSVDGGLITPNENRPINNICVLQYKERRGGKKTIFATTLNKALINSSHPRESILSIFGIPGNDADVCQPGLQGFTKCQIGEYDIHEDAEIWYSQETHALVYGRNSIPFVGGDDGSTLQKIRDWLVNLFTGESDVRDSQENFIKEATNINELFLLKNRNKQVRALKEQRGNKTMLIAEYVRFDTPICEYVNRLDFSQLARKNVNCTSDRRFARVEVLGDTDVFWSQLTGKLRVAESE
jgi:hypothetical protein